MHARWPRSPHVKRVCRAVAALQEGLSEEAALELVRACIRQLHTRFVMHQPRFMVKVVDANGVRVVEV